MIRALKAAVSLDDASPLVMRDLQLESPRDTEVVVQVAYTGVCQTDIKAMKGLQGARKPAVLGHEGVGTVVEVGAAVSRVKPGDRVLMCFASCGACQSCDGGRPSYCRNARALNMNAERADHSTAFVGGEIHSHFFGQSSFATVAIASERNVVKVANDIPLRIAAAMGCGIITGAGAVLNAMSASAGRSIAIFGAGAVGLSGAMAAKIAGLSRIIVVDTVESRLATALELGATHVFAAGDPNVVDAIQRLTDGGVDYALEAAGHPSALDNALACLGSGGVCVIAGAAGDIAGSFRWRNLMLKGATIRGTVEGDANPQIFLPQLMQFYREGRFPVEKLVRYFGFGAINEAIAAAVSGETIKPVLCIGPDPLFPEPETYRQ